MPLKKENTIYLIDGTAYIYRAYHAIRNLTNSKGLPTNAAFGFARMLIKLIKERSPAYISMFFDARGPTFRHEIYKDYKANRPPAPEDMVIQIPYIKRITEGFNIPIYEQEHYEADDLIGSFAKIAKASGFHVVIVTGDKDFMQLIDENVTLWDPMKDRILDLQFVKSAYGVEPARLVDIMGLWGDTSDNIPGVPGIGEKTAKDLIQQYGSLENLYDHLDRITKKKQKENLEDFREQAFLSRKLVTINSNVPVYFDPERLKADPPDFEKLFDLFTQLEFRQLQQEFKVESEHRPTSYHAVLTLPDLQELIEKLTSADIFALDTETSSENPMKADLIGLSFSVVPTEAYYIPLGHDYEGAPEQLDREDVLSRLKPIFENPGIKKTGQNIKYDWMVLLRHGVELNGVAFDTMLASYLINPSKRAHNLDQIAMDFCGHKCMTFKELINDTGAKNFSRVPLEKAVPYACEDADMTLWAMNTLMPELEKIGLIRLFETVEMPLIPVLMKMEMHGIAVDEHKLRMLSRGFERQLAALEQEIYILAGGEFNIKSSQQLGCILFDKLCLPIQKKTRKKTGYSTDVDVLTFLADHHDLPALVLRHRTLTKLKSTYADALIDLIHPQTGRIHTSYNQTVTATGRLSSSNPNLQNIPIRTEEGREIRSAFVPKKGWHMVSADYSQVELRILAHYSEDPILINAFLNNEDIHARTAAEIFQIFPEMITPELRRHAKIINFGIIYGMGPFSLAKELNISQKMAKSYIHNYFSRYKGVKRFIDRTIAEAKTTEKTSTLLDRIRMIPEINSSNANLRSFAERIAVNTPIQGTAADLIKLAMIHIHREIEKRGLQSAMLLTVHDELVFEVPSEELELAVSLVKTTMEGIWDLKVPLKVNIAQGENWAAAH
ncbi:MAG: DNA polymerase I [Desulfobacterales bacterium]